MLTTYGTIMKTVRCIVLGVGVIGNLFSCFIFSRPTFRQNSISTYGQALGIADLYTLTVFALDLNALLYDTDLPSQSQTQCKIFYYFSVALGSIPG